MPLHRRLQVAAVAAVLLLGVAGSASSDATPASAAASGRGATGSGPTTAAPCGWRSQSPAVYDHVVWVVFENHSYPDVIGAPGTSAGTSAPYLNALARSCGLATDYWGQTHPSLPNYLALVSGDTGGVTQSCTPAQCMQNRTTIFGQLRRQGRGWRVYAESMPARCRRTDAYPYVVRHNPSTYFAELQGECSARSVPMGTTTSGRLVDDLAADRLPSFAVVVPNQCNNSHDCSIGTADRWLSRLVPRIVASPAYRAGRTALVVTYDEGAGGSGGQSCTSNPDRSCHVATVVVSPTTTPGTRSTRRFTHYSLLETTERMFGIGTLLGHAGDRATHGMRTQFHL